jgi:hypothetical protein
MVYIELFSDTVSTTYKVKLSRYRHAGGKGERQYSFYSFLTSALGGGQWALLPGKDPRYPMDRRLGIVEKILCLYRG